MTEPRPERDAAAGAGNSKTVVTVRIAGEEYTLRAHASPEHTRECAALVDRAIQEILSQSVLIDPPKAVLLAALSLADQLLQSRADLGTARADAARFAADLAAEIEAATAASDLPAAPKTP